jgi:hypothetical protein
MTKSTSNKKIENLNIKIIKLINGEDVVTDVPIGPNQLPENSPLVRLNKPLLIKYVPQITVTGFKDYVALIRWCSYTKDQIITIPKDKILTITNASAEMASSYMNLAKNYEEKPVSVRNQNYSKQSLTDEDNKKINEIFDDLDDEDTDITIH